MRVLVLESVSGFQLKADPRLLPEGFAMLRTMVNEFKEGGFDVVTILNRRLKKFVGWFDGDVFFDRGGLSEAMRLKPDAALVIAPERNGELERITTKLMKSGIPVLGARKEAIRVSGNKWLAYSTLKGKVPQPKTWRKPPRFKGQILVKPVNGVGCEGIRFSSSHPHASGTIFQEFINGEHASCCLLMGEEGGTVLSVNKQEVVIHEGRFRYSGSEIPLEHELAGECAEIALRAAQALNLRGFCGVDLVVDEVPNFMELNPRVTTSFIALAEVLEANLGEILIDVMVNRAPPPKPELRGHSILRIPRTRSDIKINEERLSELREIPGIVAPPFAPNGWVKKGSPMFVVVGSGKTARGAERGLGRTVDEASSLLGVEIDALGWS